MKRTQADFREVRVRKRPVIPAAIPPISSHIDLSVGVPVKKRDTSEPKDSDALMPKIVSTIPAINSPMPSALFINSLSQCCLLFLSGDSSSALASPNERDEEQNKKEHE